MTDLLTENRRLQQANAFLAEQCKNLRQLLPSDSDRLPLEWGLTARETDLLALLAKREFWSYQALLNALYADEIDPPPHHKILTVWVCKIKRKLDAKQVPVTIGNVWGRGYTLSVEARDYLKSKMLDSDSGPSSVTGVEGTVAFARQAAGGTR
jgi:DNA-binding response OmpR family regulator